MTKIEKIAWLEQAFKLNENEEYAWRNKQDSRKHAILKDNRIEREILNDVWLEVTGSPRTPAVPEPVAVGPDGNEGEGNGPRHPVLV